MTSATGDAQVARPISHLEVSNEAAAVAASLTGKVRDRIYLGNGVVLKIHPVPPLAMREAATSIPPPAPPIVRIESQDREEENPNDPDYLAEFERWQLKQLARVADVMLILGTSLQELPTDGSLVPPEDEDWIEMLEAVGLSVPKTNKYARYLSWLRLYAVRSEQDLSEVFTAVVQASGVTELEVQRAAAAFLDSAR